MVKQGTYNRNEWDYWWIQVKGYNKEKSYSKEEMMLMIKKEFANNLLGDTGEEWANRSSFRTLLGNRAVSFKTYNNKLLFEETLY